MKTSPLLLGLLAVALTPGAHAHTIWLQADTDAPRAYDVYFGGHAGALTPYDARRIASLRALDATGAEVAVTRTGTDDAARISVDGDAVLIVFGYDNGIHTRTGSGPSVKAPMDEVPGAITATNAQKFHKTIVRWGSDVVSTPVGQAFEVTPLSARAPAAGAPMRVQVRIDGVPAEGIHLGRGEDTRDATTDAEGIASFVPVAGNNRIWAGRRLQVSGEPRYTELSYEYSFGFDVP